MLNRTQPLRPAALLGWCLGVGLSLLLCHSAAAAEGSPKEKEAPRRYHHLDFTATAWFDRLGGAVWYSVPMLRHGLIDQLDDSLDVEFGGSLTVQDDHGDHGTLTGLTPLGGLKWQFFLNDSWTTFATAKLGAFVGLGEGGAHLQGGGSLGAYWRAQNDIFLRVEVGYPEITQIGISLPL